VAAVERQTLQGSGRQRPSFSTPRLRRGVHRPAAAALRSGAGAMGVAGKAALPRLRCRRCSWPGVMGWGDGLGCRKPIKRLARLRGR